MYYINWKRGCRYNVAQFNMGWEDRAGRKYYYEKVRSGQSVRSVYRGSGIGAEVLSQTKNVFRSLRDNERCGRLRVEQEIQSTDVLLEEIGGLNRKLFNAFLLAHGYHAHKGQWRRRRRVPAWKCGLVKDRRYDMSIANAPQQALGVGNIAVPTQQNEPSVEALRQSLQPCVAEIERLSQALEGDKDNKRALWELRRLFEQTPRLWDLPGALEREAARQIAAKIHRDRERQREILSGMDSLRAQLGYASSDPMERILIDQIALQWAELQVTNIIYAVAGFDGVQPRNGTFWAKRIEQLEKRYQRAVESLARVRRLIRPAKVIQLNVANSQVVAKGSVLEPHPRGQAEVENVVNLDNYLTNLWDSPTIVQSVSAET